VAHNSARVGSFELNRLSGCHDEHPERPFPKNHPGSLRAELSSFTEQFGASASSEHSLSSLLS
jgi:hypothetical protein